MKSLLVLGSTGSIGTQTLDVVRSQKSAFRIEALCAGSDWQKLLEQTREFSPRVVGLADAAAGERLRAQLPLGTSLVCGPQVASEFAANCDFDLAVHGIVGAAGLLASAQVLARGKNLALANKESLVIGGAILMDLARENHATILPVDSELCAIHQCLGAVRPDQAGWQAHAASSVRRVIVTASGGSLRDRPLADLAGASVEDALRHPNWDMGPRITVGSATLMNKALEVLEVQHLFGLAPEQIQVVLHRQSVVHSMVEFVDGSVLAQMGPADMRGPLHYCLHWPARVPSVLPGFDVALFSKLTFEPVELERFPAMGLGLECLQLGAGAGCVLNAADEEAVAAFLDRRLSFGDIVPAVQATLAAWRSGNLTDMADTNPPRDWRARVARVLELDAAARRYARSCMALSTRS